MVETYIVYPSNKHNRPASPDAIKLHSLDGLSAPIQIHNHRFFQSTERHISEIVEKLKSALAEALEFYPPVAGTVLINDNGDIYIDTHSENGSGTPLLVDIKDTPYTHDTEDLSPRTEVILPPGSSTFAAKITKFSCGTICVATSIHHQVTDLRGFLEFLEAWAQIARGEPIDISKIPDDWSRNPSRFFSGLISESTVPPPPIPFELLETPATGVPEYLMQPSKITNWKISSNSLEQLKNDFSPSASGDGWISSGDALATLLCGAVTRARHNANVPRLVGRSTLESDTEKVAMAADGRERAPRGDMAGKYYGNFNNLPGVIMSRSDLLSLTNESAARIAVAIRKGLNDQLSPESIAKRIAFFEAPETNTPPGRILFTADVILTNWCRFDLQSPKLGFGWGKPFLATSGGGTVYPPAYSIMTQNKVSGETFVMLTVEEAGEEALKADELMNKYATLIPNQPSV